MTDTRPPTEPQPLSLPGPKPLSLLSLSAFVISLPSLCLFPFALISLPMGIVAITRTGVDAPRGGRGLAIAATAISAVGLLMSCLQVGIFLPAIGAARQAAWRLEDQTQFETAMQDLSDYASAKNGNLPADDEDWRDILIRSGTPASVFTSNAYGGDPAFIYFVPAPTLTGEPDRVLLYTRPDLYARGGGSVGYHDGHIEHLSALEFDPLIRSLTLPDGTPWAPHLDD